MRALILILPILFSGLASAVSPPSLPITYNGKTYSQAIRYYSASGGEHTCYFENGSVVAGYIPGWFWIAHSRRYDPDNVCGGTYETNGQLAVQLGSYSVDCPADQNIYSSIPLAVPSGWGSAYQQCGHTYAIGDAFPHIPSYQLAIQISPAVALPGSVTSSPAGISCGMNPETCQADFSGNVTLTAVPEEGWTFSHWVDGGTNYSDNPRMVSMSGAKTMKAVFHLLSFPLSGYTPYTVPTSSVFDHSATGEYGNDVDHHVETFNGEVSDNQSPYSGTTCYPKPGNSSAFGLGFTYVGYSQAGVNYLCYDGHPGYDYAVAYGTDVYAAADGVAHLPESFPGVSNAQGYATVEIDHGNGYKTYYLHLSSQTVTENQQVYGGQTVIGRVGHTVPQGAASVGNHLHFEVQLNGVPVDPNGWTGSGADPYTAATNDVLWK